MSNSDDTEHDAILRVFDTSDRLGRKIIGWRWSDRRPTLSHNEYEEADVLIEKAEDRIDPSELDHGTVLARIWMDGETVDRVNWNDQYVDTEADHPTEESNDE